MTALILASVNGELEIVVYLVEHGANVAHTDSEGMTALHGACANGNLLFAK
jgi:ankyrin repeat protein